MDTIGTIRGPVDYLYVYTMYHTVFGEYELIRINSLPCYHSLLRRAAGDQVTIVDHTPPESGQPAFVWDGCHGKQSGSPTVRWSGHDYQILP